MFTVEDAKKIAIKAHKGQFRHDHKTPYIIHPEAVAESYNEKDETEKIVAWLHDVIEDSDITLQDLIAKRVPFDVVVAIDALTKKGNESYLEYLLRLKKNDLAREVKIRDIRHNAETGTKSQKKKYELAKYIVEQ